TRKAPGTGRAPGHGDDVEYVFGNVKDQKGYDETDHAISDVIIEAFVRFVETGDPNGPGLVDWPAYSEAGDQYLEIGDKISLRSNWRTPQMVFLHKYLGGN
ncbi:MAG: carboxylesterase family protein, partial [Pseudomonadota bacterium]|nr:carboxylesterase family protein [Pseudomonadota bacterium]